MHLSREQGSCLVWDDSDHISLIDRTGRFRSQFHAPDRIACAAASDDGSAIAAAFGSGKLAFFGDDFTPQWEKSLPYSIRSVALDSFGQYLAVGDKSGALHAIDRKGNVIWQTSTARPLLYLGFIPESPHVVGAADFGLVTCHEFSGRCAWRDAPVSHVGSMTMTGDGSRICFSCYSDGLRSYSLEGARLPRHNATVPCRLAAIAHDGHCLLLADTTSRIHLLDMRGESIWSDALEKPPTALALDALGHRAVLALPDGRVVCLDMRAG